MKTNKQIVAAEKRNPIIALLAPFYAAAGVNALYGDGSQDTGQPVDPDRTIQSILNFAANTFYRQLYMPIKTRNGSMPNLKERMDNSEYAMMKLYEEHDGRQDALRSDPQALLTAHRRKVDEERFNGVREILFLFTEAYKYHTGDDWQFVDNTTNTSSPAHTNGKAALESFLAKLPSRPPEQTAQVVQAA